MQLANQNDNHAAAFNPIHIKNLIDATIQSEFIKREQFTPSFSSLTTQTEEKTEEPLEVKESKGNASKVSVQSKRRSQREVIDTHVATLESPIRQSLRLKAQRSLQSKNV